MEKPLKAADMRPVLRTSPAEVAKAGDTLRVELDAPAKPSYVYLSYFTADEKVITLAQPQGAVLPQTPPKFRQVFGDGQNGHGKFTVQAPFGREMVVAITSASPLFDGPLPKVQSEREFLSTLRKALVYRPLANLPERRVESVRRYLMSHYNIPASKLTAKGFGSVQLLDPEHPLDGVNRRVQIVNMTTPTTAR